MATVSPQIILLRIHETHSFMRKLNVNLQK